MILSWYGLLLVALAAYRTWRLLALDLILDKPRARIVRGEPVSELVSCVWCLGAWVTIGWWAAWWAWPHTTVLVAVPFALSTLVGLVGSVVGTLED